MLRGFPVPVEWGLQAEENVNTENDTMIPASRRLLNHA